MEYQIDTRNHRTQEVRVGFEDQEVAVFRKVNFLIFNLEAKIGGIPYGLKLPAPWNGFRYRLFEERQELANARKLRRMHAFDKARPLIRHMLVEFELEVGDRLLHMVPDDRHGTEFDLLEGEEPIGRLALRSFEVQTEGGWQADVQVPDDWSAAHAAFVAWLAREGRRGMSS
ncbi:MAG: hypothetical protein KDD47_10495 [Acidobacteria bacterium]|nr:hypothetical protein [Acidobacteriota bacterium]